MGDAQLAFNERGEREDLDIPDLGSAVFRWNGGGLNRFVNVRFAVTNLPEVTNLDAVQDGAAGGCAQRGNLDFDGDGRDDFAIWRPTQGMWAILKSSVAGNDLIWKQWGLPGDHPKPGDYTGDGKADLVVWRPTEGNWYVCKSDVDFDCSQPTIQQFGLPGDVPIEGDFDGDRILDFAVWRPSNGNFYYRSSFNTVVTERQWGLPGDIPLQGGRNQ